MYAARASWTARSESPAAGKHQPGVGRLLIRGERVRLRQSFEQLESACTVLRPSEGALQPRQLVDGLRCGLQLRIEQRVRIVEAAVAGVQHRKRLRRFSPRQLFSSEGTHG